MPLKITLAFLLLPYWACSQQSAHNSLALRSEAYKNVVKEFYTLLYKENVSISQFSSVYEGASIDDDSYRYLNDSLKLTSQETVPSKLLIDHTKDTDPSTTSSYVFKKVKEQFSELTNGLVQSKIFKLIENAEICDQGLQFSAFLELSPSDTKKIYFELSKDSPTQILYVWLKGGTSLYSIISRAPYPQRLLLVGGIGDKDGFVYIRNKPSKEAKIIGKVRKDEYFYYIPDENYDWCPVLRKDDTNSIVGYIHKSRIIKYSQLPQKLKKIVIMDRKGC